MLNSGKYMEKKESDLMYDNNFTDIYLSNLIYSKWFLFRNYESYNE